MPDFSDANVSDPAAIAANRRGELTPEQRARLNLTTSLMGCWSGFFLLYIPLVFGYTAFVAWRDNPKGGQEIVQWVVIPTVVLTIIMFFARLFYRRKKRAALTDKVAQADGSVIWDGSNYAAMVGERRLRVNGNMNLPPGAYRLYYLARTGWLLSAEKIAERE